jgi:hypothetical protein
MGRVRCLVVVALTVLLAANGAVPWPTARPSLLTDDRNHDGRPDVWRWYDADGRLVRVEIDSNFDARPDDVVELDPDTSEVVREDIDTNLNGSADVLRLYAHGTVAYSESATDDTATPVFRDPFLRDLAARPDDDGSHALIAALVSSGVAPQPPPVYVAYESRAMQFPQTPSACSVRRGSTPLRGPPVRSL